MTHAVLYLNLFFLAIIIWRLAVLYSEHRGSIKNFREWIRKNIPETFSEKYSPLGHISAIRAYATLRRYQIDWPKFKSFVLERIEKDPNERRWKNRLPIKTTWLHVFAHDCRLEHHKKVYGDKDDHMEV